ncbi:MAG: addiction module protein [Planctomycetaceae bacterium]
MVDKDSATPDLDIRLNELLSLPPQDRLRLAERLIESLPLFATPELEREWNEEIARRIEDFESGKLPGIPAEEVHARIWQRLNETSKAGREQ